MAISNPWSILDYNPLCKAAIEKHGIEVNLIADKTTIDKNGISPIVIDLGKAIDKLSSNNSINNTGTGSEPDKITNIEAIRPVFENAKK